MRLIVVPLTLKQSLVYCQRTKALPLARQTPRLDDKLVQRVNKTWTEWQSSDVKWKKSLVSWTDKMLATISYDEWSLKSVPGRNDLLRQLRSSAKSPKSPIEGSPTGGSPPPEVDEKVKTPVLKHEHEHGGKSIGHVSVDYIIKNNLPSSIVESIPVLYCRTIYSQQDTINKLQQLVTRSKHHHKRYFWYSLVGAPLTLPFALLPVIPNIPGFYLLFRAWSHWKAMTGGSHLEYLLKDDHLHYVTSKELESFYEDKLQRAKLTQKDDTDARLIYQEDIDSLVDISGCKEIGAELVRALRQIEQKKKKGQNQ